MNDIPASHSSHHLLAEQESIRFPLPVVVRNADYSERRALLERISELLHLSGVEDELVSKYVAQVQQDRDTPLSNRRRLSLQATARLAIRCNILKSMSDESYRVLSAHIADSPLMQRFIGIDRIDVIQVPSKSTLERFYHMIPESVIRGLVTRLLEKGCEHNAEQGNALGLVDTLCMDVGLLDSTCVKLNMHYPADWVLLHDGIKSIMHSIEQIRRHGLRHRMPSPKKFLKQTNNLCIEMTHAKNKASSKKDRKRILRSFKKLANQSLKHARRYRDLLAEDMDQERGVCDLHAGDARQVLVRLDNILEKLPTAIELAHERIIGERRIANTDKMLSLYESHSCVYIRGKSGAQIEYGLQLLLCENMDGLITDWDLFDGHPQKDTQHLQPCVLRLQNSGPSLRPKVIVGDRGFYSAANVEWLEEHGIEDVLCPLNVDTLQERLGEESFRRYQTRRAQTEARVGIVKSKFLGTHMPAKGYERQNRHCAWCMLAHNLWVIARLPIPQVEEDEEEYEFLNIDIA